MHIVVIIKSIYNYLTTWGEVDYGYYVGKRSVREMEYFGVSCTEAVRRRSHTGEDDENISDMVKKFLVKEGYSVDSCFNGDEALLRRSRMLKKEISVGKLKLYLLSYRVDYDGKDIGVAPKEFDILLLLVRNKGIIIPHETLLTKIWGYDFDGNEGIIHTRVKRLRDKLPPGIIKTVKGLGYCLEDNI